MTDPQHTPADSRAAPHPPCRVVFQPHRVSQQPGDICLRVPPMPHPPSGVPRKPGMTRDDLFNINAGIVKNLVTGAAKHCPEVRLAAAARAVVIL